MSRKMATRSKEEPLEESGEEIPVETSQKEINEIIFKKLDKLEDSVSKIHNDLKSHFASLASYKRSMERDIIESLDEKLERAFEKQLARIEKRFDILTDQFEGRTVAMERKKDEPFAWESREYLRTKLIGKEICHTNEYVIPGSGKEIGFIYLGKDTSAENITESLISEGLVEVQRAGIRQDNEAQQNLIVLEDAAKPAGKGKWSAEGAEKLRAVEKEAKEQKLRLWKDVKPSGPAIDVKDKSFTAKVDEINGDGMVVKQADSTLKKIFLSSVRPPRPTESAAATEEGDGKKPVRAARVRARPLYDIPYMFEAREFLMKKLIGKKVQVQVDYIQAANDSFPEKTCCTISISNTNVAEALISKGLGTAVRYRPDDDQRSSAYDLLLTAEARAQKKGVGVHSTKEALVIRVVDVAGDVAKSKQFLPFLQRAGRCEAVVEFVASCSRWRLYIPRKTCLISFLLSGITCPRGSRSDPNRPGSMIPAEPFGDEAAQFTKDLCLHHEVVVEVEFMDKGGNFIGYLYGDGVNVSVAMVENGLSSVHFTAEKISSYNALLRAEEKAKAAKLKMWANYVESKEVEEKPEENEPSERTVSHKTIVITEVGKDLKFFQQHCDKGPQLEKLMEQLRQEMTNNPPLPGAYTPKKGDICAAKFIDGQWYRAKEEKAQGPKAHVLYIDYGNREETNSTKMAALPGAFSSLPAQAQEYKMACVQLPPEEDQISEAIYALTEDILNRQCLVNVEYKRESVEFVTLPNIDNKEDIGQNLAAEGLLLVDNRKERRLAKLMAGYVKAQDKAKNERLMLWRYGDSTADDAKEFGYQR